MNFSNSYNGETKEKEVSYTPVTKSDKVSYTEEPKNFFKKSQIQLQAVTKFDNFEKFCNAFKINTDNPESIKSVEPILEEIQKTYDQLKYGKARLQILYALHKEGLKSFEQLKDMIHLNQKILSNLLNELLINDLVVKVSRNHPKAKYYNDVLHYSGEGKKKHFYKLNENNDLIKQHISILPKIIDKGFQERVEENIQFFNTDKESFERFEKAKEEKEQYRKQRTQTKLSKIREALIPLIGRTEYSIRLREFLHYGKGLISKNSWAGHRDNRGNYDGGWEGYLLQQGFLEDVTQPDSNQKILYVSKKMNPNYIPKENENSGN